MKVLSPIGASARASFRPAPALPALSSRRVGVLSNGKMNALPLLGEIAELLVSRHDMQRSTTFSLTEKAQGPGFPAPPWIVETLATSSALTLVGVGD